MKITHYMIKSISLRKPYIIALISYLHNNIIEDLADSLENTKPDFIAVNGDVLCAAVPGKSIYEKDPHGLQHLADAHNSLCFLQFARNIAPIFFSTGNHELYFDQEDEKILCDLGILFLDNRYIKINDIVFGGLSSPYWVLANTGKTFNKAEHIRRWDLLYNSLDENWIGSFAGENGYKILLCHHPEFYDRFLKNRGIDLVLSGHTHGGQLRVFNHGLYAYRQGWFPKYSGGCYDSDGGKLIVSCGLSNTSKWPRINNPLELVYIKLMPVGGNI